MRRSARLAAIGVVGASAACTPPPQMCSTESIGHLPQAHCGPEASCVAGRCVGRGASPAIATARRELYAPVDLAYVRAGDSASPTPPAIASLGAQREGVLFLRFAVPLGPELDVLEAYVLLHRASETSPDPAPVILHAARITEPWTGRWVSWARQPHVDDAGAALTRVRATMGPWVRLDVRPIVERWRRRDADDFGIAVRSDARNASGVAVALAPSPAAVFDLSRSDTAEPQGAAEAAPEVVAAIAVGPQLELYVK